MITVTDWEWTMQFTENGNDGSPFNPHNKLVCGGFKYAEKFEPTRSGIGSSSGQSVYWAVGHIHAGPSEGWMGATQVILNKTTLLVGHNIRADLTWLKEVGFVYDGPIYDTMLTEYVLAEGLHVDLDLNSCCLRYGLEGKKDGVADYWNKKINTDDIPWDVLETYGIQDIDQTWQLFWKQLEKLGCTIEELGVYMS